MEFLVLILENILVMFDLLYLVFGGFDEWSGGG